MSTKRPQVLIVDDEPHNIEVISEILGREEFSLTVAGNGKLAWEILEQSPECYDVILLDRMMPKMDGMQVLKKIKQHDVLRYCPVILQTAKSEKCNILEGIKAGAYYYLAKPFDNEMLISIVRSAISERLNYLAKIELLEDCYKNLELMDIAQFQFRQVEEAQRISILLSRACPDPERVINGLSELMVNAVEHGNLGLTYEEKTALLETGSWENEINKRMYDDKYKDRYAVVDFHRSRENIEIIITDQGDGFNWEEYLNFDPGRSRHTHGRGIAMVNNANFASLEYQGKGNVVKFSVPLV